MSLTYNLPFSQRFGAGFNFIQSVVRFPSSIALLTPKGIYLLNSIFPSPLPTQALDTTAQLSGPMAVAEFLLSEAYCCIDCIALAGQNTRHSHP